MSRPADLLLRLGDTTPAWPTTGQISLYAKNDGVFYKLDANGNETPLVGGSGGTGTVTSVDIQGTGGITVLGGPVTSAGAFTLGLGNITPTSIVASGTIVGANLIGMNTGDETLESIKTKLGVSVLTGVNTGDQTITLTGDVNGSGTGTFVTTLTNVNPDVGTFGNPTKIPVITVDSKGRITSVTAQDISITSTHITQALGYTPYNSTNPAGFTSNTGTVIRVGMTASNGINVSGGDITTTGDFALSLGDITPSSITTTGDITANNLTGINTGDETTASILGKLNITEISGVNTGDQIITLTGDVTGSGTGTFPTSLAVVNTNIGTFGSSTQIPVLTVDDKGRVIGISTVAVGQQQVAGVSTFNGRVGDVALTHTDVVSALGFTPYENTNPSGYGTVSYIAIEGEDGIEVNGSPITTTGTVSLHLTDIKPFSVAASGTVTGSNLSGINTGDQTITLVGDVTGTGTGEFTTTLAEVNSNPQSNTFSKLTVNSKGLVTSTTPVLVSDITDVLGYLPYDSSNPNGYTNNLGTVTQITVTGNNGIQISGSPITDAGTVDISLGDITPDSVVSAGTIIGSNLSGVNTGDETEQTILDKLGIDSIAGVNTGDQTITLTGDVTGSGTGVFTTTLSETGAVAGVYDNPTITVDSKGRILSISSGGGVPGTGTVTSVGLVSPNDTIYVQGTPVTSNGVLEVDLQPTGVTAGAYVGANVTVDEYGRIVDIESGTAQTPTFEKVVFKYTSGSGGTLAGEDCIVSTTSGVTATIVDGPNCMARYTFTGRTTLPKSIAVYGQVYGMNEFVISDMTSLPASNRRIMGGGTADSPALITGMDSTNTVLLQHRMSDTGSSASLGQRAHLIIIFGF